MVGMASLAGNAKQQSSGPSSDSARLFIVRSASASSELLFDLRIEFFCPVPGAVDAEMHVARVHGVIESGEAVPVDEEEFFVALLLSLGDHIADGFSKIDQFDASDLASFILGNGVDGDAENFGFRVLFSDDGKHGAIFFFELFQ